MNNPKLPINENIVQYALNILGDEYFEITEISWFPLYNKRGLRSTKDIILKISLEKRINNKLRKIGLPVIIPKYYSSVKEAEQYLIDIGSKTIRDYYKYPMTDKNKKVF